MPLRFHFKINCDYSIKNDKLCLTTQHLNSLYVISYTLFEIILSFKRKNHYEHTLKNTSCTQYIICTFSTYIYTVIDKSVIHMIYCIYGCISCIQQGARGST